MAWTAPMTAVAGSVFTAAQFNTFIRDNFNETAPAKASTSGSLFVGTGLNAIAERTPAFAFVTDSETTTSTSYTDLATAGPSVTVTTGAGAIVAVFAQVSNNTAGEEAFAGHDITGATTRAASDTRSIGFQPGSVAAARSIRCSAITYQDALTPGSNTFTMKYRVTGGTGTFNDRRITVIPL